jgi:orotate phosphoribosyltransferase-like protein
MSYDEPQRVVVSKKRAAAALDVSVDTIDRLVARGELESVQVSDRRVGVTWRSILKRGTPAR